ncbi:MAG: radical SAM family heme chaperone HemW [Thiovulaceae bacterium]|nr:radical SAM family heme chaperone HemW [Sulfurimonadaceae bacterium]
MLYIHIPFCDSKCSYCAFNSYVDKFHLKQKYIDALLQQLDFELKIFDMEKKSIKTLFLGGGTPSTISPKLYEPLFKKIKPYLASDAEITSEANPNSATREWLLGMKELGVNRLSFGVQSFNEDKLKLLNRAHNSKQAKEAVKLASELGYKNISLDLIYATQGDTKELLQNDIDEAFKLPINHLSAYALTIEEGTAFESKPQMSKENLDLTTWLFDEISKYSFEQYEISNFGSYKSKHNLGYWQYRDYIGLGSGAVGKKGNERFYPVSDIDEYIKNPLNIQKEILNDSDILFEKIFLGLRSIIGIDKHILNTKEIERANTLVKENKLKFHSNTYYNPNFLLADEIAIFLTNFNS